MKALELFVLPKTSSVIHDTVYKGDGYSKYGFDIAEMPHHGTYGYTQTTVNQSGCDSTVNLILEVIYHTDATVVPTLFTPYNRDGEKKGTIEVFKED